MDRSLVGYSLWSYQRGGHDLATKGFPGGSVGKESACNAGDLGSVPGKIPRRREWLRTPVLWPGESHGLYSRRGRRVGHD